MFEIGRMHQWGELSAVGQPIAVQINPLQVDALGQQTFRDRTQTVVSYVEGVQWGLPQGDVIDGSFGLSEAVVPHEQLFQVAEMGKRRVVDMNQTAVLDIQNFELLQPGEDTLFQMRQMSTVLQIQSGERSQFREGFRCDVLDQVFR